MKLNAFDHFDLPNARIPSDNYTFGEASFAYLTDIASPKSFLVLFLTKLAFLAHLHFKIFLQNPFLSNA